MFDVSLNCSREGNYLVTASSTNYSRWEMLSHHFNSSPHLEKLKDQSEHKNQEEKPPVEILDTQLEESITYIVRHECTVRVIHNW